MQTATTKTPKYWQTNDDIREFVDRLRDIGSSFKSPKVDRREHERLEVTLLVEVTPMGDDFRPTDTIFKSISRNVSETGLGVICPHPIDCSFVFVTVHGPEKPAFDALCQVVHSSPIDDFFRVGLQFVPAE